MHRAEVMVYSQLSGLEEVVFSVFIKDDFIPEGDGQVASGSASLPDLPDPVVLGGHLVFHMQVRRW